MGFFQKIGRAFKKAPSIFSKGAREIGGVFRKTGSTVARGLGSIAGGGIGAELGGGLALAIGQPELAPAFSAVGGLIGRSAGGEGASRIEQATRGVASGKRPLLGTQGRRSDSPSRMAMPPLKPPILPSPKPRVGANGGGIYRGGSMLEKTKPKPKRNFV